MARVFRVVKLNDRFNTQAFSLILSRTLLQDDNLREHVADIVYSCHKWTVTVTHTGKTIGAFLTLPAVSAGLSCTVDFAITFMNSEHFTRNERFAERTCTFNSITPTHGRQAVLGLSDLLNRGFLFEGGQFLVEVELKSLTTCFDEVLCHISCW